MLHIAPRGYNGMMFAFCLGHCKSRAVVIVCMSWITRSIPVSSVFCMSAMRCAFISTNSLFHAMLQTVAKDIAIMKQIEWHKGQLRALKGVFNEIVARQAF